MWAQILASLVGLWLMAAPAVLGYGEPARTNDQIVGPLVASFACIAWWEAMRGVRWANVPLGVWLVVAPFVLGYGATAAVVNSVVVGAAVVALALVRGRTKREFGGGWATLWRPAGHAPPASRS